MAALFHWLDRAIMWAMGIVVIVTSLAVTVLILFLVLARFVLDWSVVGVLELATLSAMWLYMSGAVIAARNRQHLVVDFLSLSLPSPRAKALHDLAISMIMVLLSVFFIGLARDMVDWSIARPQTTAALSLPLMIPQSSIVLASCLFVIYALRDLVLAARIVLGFSTPETGEI
jgi:TRAP-type transport system small permease protein